MAIYANGGKLISKDGTLGSGAGCCCGSDDPCGASCGPSTPCQAGCKCIGCLCIASSCELPDQITLNASGIPTIFLHGSSYGGVVSAVYVSEWAEFCGFDSPCLASVAMGGSINNAWYASLASRDESSIVLDRDCGATYTGVLPDLASTYYSFNDFQGFNQQSCGNGGVSGVRGVSVSLSLVRADTSVSVAAPSWGEVTAEAAVNIADGQVESIDVTDGGDGYAREIMERTAPTIEAAITGGAGVGATLTVTLAQNGQGEQATWSVSSVSVTDGGTGYTGSETVAFTPEAGATTDLGAFAQVIIGRSAPTVTASASGGTGGTLSVSLAQGFDWWTNQPYWYIDSVSVTNGGSGYEDGGAVSFTVTDGQADYQASASIAAVDGVIESVYVSSGGAYYKTSGVVQSVQVWDGGSYYIEQGSGEVESDTPEVTIASNTGEGASATATVDDTLGSPTFGQITSIEVDEGGQSYESGVDRWRITITYDGLSHTTLASRFTSNPCPSELLSRSYAMSISVNSIPGLFNAQCGQPAAVTDNGDDTSRYRFDGISVSLSPA